MKYTISDSRHYYSNEIESLGWELSICNSLELKNSPIRAILKKNDTYGNLLFDYLSNYIDFCKYKNLIEIGGGYGVLMRDFLLRSSNLGVVMLDISGFLLKRQFETLQKSIKDLKDIQFIEKDFFDISLDFLTKFDVAILNEVIGDFFNVVHVDIDRLSIPDENDPIESSIWNFFKKYNLHFEENGLVNVNLGAMKAVEKLCKSGINYIFISEHSCESNIPTDLLNKRQKITKRTPERIMLKGHDEYTTKFSYLEKIAKKLGYKIIRGQIIDYIDIKYSDRVNFIFKSNTQISDHEIIRQFIYDLFHYEYILLIRK